MAVNPPALRLRRPPRVRRDPIDISPINISLVAVEAAEADPSLDADEILAALEAKRARIPDPVPDPVVIREPVVAIPGSGISVDQVRAWLDQVQSDLRKVRARVEYLTAEQARLDEQQRLMAQLLTTSSPPLTRR